MQRPRLDMHAESVRGAELAYQLAACSADVESPVRRWS